LAKLTLVSTSTPKNATSIVMTRTVQSHTIKKEKLKRSSLNSVFHTPSLGNRPMFRLSVRLEDYRHVKNSVNLVLTQETIICGCLCTVMITRKETGARLVLLLSLITSDTSL
jgi:hypothetical protein